MARPSRRSARIAGIARTHRSALAGLAVLLSAGTLAALPAPSYASSTVCGTPLATVLGQDCTAPVANVYRAKADHGYQDLLSDPQTTSDNAEFFLNLKQADPDGKKVTYRCQLTRGETVVEAWTDCTYPDPSNVSSQSLGNVEYTGLTPGSYTLSAKATDAAVDKLLIGSSAPNEQADPGTQFTWTVTEPVDDTTPPDTRLTRSPKRWNLSQFGDWEYAGNEPLAGAVCTLQGRRMTRSCDSAQAFASLNAGDVTFTVAGKDYAGNVDPSPAVSRFTVPVPSTKLRASGGWSRGTEIGYFFNTYATTKKKGATLSAARAGTRSVALVVTTCPGCGTVKVSYGGKVLKKVSLASSTRRKRQLVPIASWGSGHGGTVTVTVTSSGKPVVVEGLGFSKRR
jgi:hypothetical protein